MKTLLLFVACLIVTGRAAMADCPCGTHSELTGEIVCSWFYYYDTDEWDFRCDNVSDCVEIEPEDPDWTPILCADADVLPVHMPADRPKPIFSGKKK